MFTKAKDPHIPILRLLDLAGDRIHLTADEEEHLDKCSLCMTTIAFLIRRQEKAKES